MLQQGHRWAWVQCSEWATRLDKCRVHSIIRLVIWMWVILHQDCLNGTCACACCAGYLLDIDSMILQYNIFNSMTVFLAELFSWTSKPRLIFRASSAKSIPVVESRLESFWLALVSATFNRTCSWQHYTGVASIPWLSLFAWNCFHMWYDFCRTELLMFSVCAVL